MYCYATDRYWRKTFGSHLFVSSMPDAREAAVDAVIARPTTVLRRSFDAALLWLLLVMCETW